MKNKKKKNLKQDDLKSPNKGNDNENNKNKSLSPNENIDDLSPLDPKKQINQTCVKQGENMNEDGTNNEQSADLIDSKNLKNANLRKNKYKTPTKNKEVNSSKISKLTSPKSGASNTNLSDRNNSNNGKLMNNFFDSDSKLKDPRLNRFKAKEKFLRKNNLSVNTKDPNLKADANSGSESAKNEQNKNHLEFMDLDSYANVRLAEAKKKAMLGFSKNFNYWNEIFFLC